LRLSTRMATSSRTLTNLNQDQESAFTKDVFTSITQAV
jgi:hypothetical protein